MATPDDPHKKTYWLDNGRNVDRLAYGVYLVCGVLLLIGLFVPRHAHFTIEHVYGFYSIFGFVAYVALVLAAVALRFLLMRPEDYYDR